MRFVISFLAMVVFILSWAFLFASVWASVKASSPAHSVSTASILSFGGLLIAMAFAFFLEGVQQAANSSKSVDGDVVAKVSANPTLALSIGAIKEKYEAFSAARQFLSVVTILYLKTLIENLVPVGFVKDFSVAHHTVSLGNILRNDFLQFACAASIIAWSLQLLPKRIARLDPIGFMQPLRLRLGTILQKLGEGLEVPVDFSMWILRKLPLGISGLEAKYPLSSNAVVSELSNRIGYVASEVSIRFVIDDRTKILHQATIQTAHQGRAEGQDIGSIRYIFSTMGMWSVPPVTSRCTKNGVRTNTETTWVRREEMVTSMFEFVDEHTEADPEEGTDSEPELNAALTGAKHTKVNVEASFSEALNTHRDRLEKTMIEMVLEEALPEPWELKRREFVFTVSVPVRKLNILVSTTHANAPTACRIDYLPFGAGTEEVIEKFSQLEQNELLEGETFGSKVQIENPLFGSQFTLRASA